MSDDRYRLLYAFIPPAINPMEEQAIDLLKSVQEELGAPCHRINAGEQLVGVERQGTRELQWLPVSGDAFVWLGSTSTSFEGLARLGRSRRLAP